MGLPSTRSATQEGMMAKFQPTPDQQRIIDAGNRWFEESRKPGAQPYSKRFVAKCTSETASFFLPRKLMEILILSIVSGLVVAGGLWLASRDTHPGKDSQDD